MMKQRVLLLVLMLFLFFSYSLLWALERNITFSLEDLRLHVAGDSIKMELLGAFPLVAPGKPRLFFKPMTFFIPEATRIEDVKIFPLEVETLSLGKPLCLNPLELNPLYRNETAKTAESVSPYPQKPLLSFSSGGLFGHSVGSIAFAPLQYFPKEKKLLFYKKTRVSFVLSRDPDFLKPLRTSPLAQREREEIWKRCVLNPQDLPSDYHKRQNPIYVKPKEFPSLEGGLVSMIIITTYELEESFEPLIEWRTSEGIPTICKTVSWIDENYSGADLAEKIRNFLKDAYQYWGINWVLLGGDPELIPKKELYLYLPGVDSFYFFIPSDKYYSDLECDWDSNKNGLLGEFADSVDLYPDIIVGRFPLRTPEEVDNFLSKLFLYEKNPGDGDPSYLKKALFMGSSMCYEGDGGEMCEEVVSHFPDSFFIGRIYESEAYDPPVREFIDSLESGFGIVHSYSHGYFDRIMISSMGNKSYFFTYHARDLNNYSRPFFSYNSACDIGGDDKECMAEALFRSNGGAIGVLSLSRLDFPAIEKYYAIEFFDSLFNNSLFRIGSLIGASEIALVPIAQVNTPYRYELYGHNFDGEPAMPLWYWVPKRLLVETSESLTLGVETVEVYVIDSMAGSPVESALVTLYKENEILVTATTGWEGRARIQVIPETRGSLTLVVKERNHLPKELRIPVLAPKGYPSLTGCRVEDEIYGDGDGIPEPGETLFIYLNIFNSGEGKLRPQIVKISSLHGQAIVLKDTSLLDELGVGESQDIGPFEVYLSPILTDREKLNFLVKFKRGLPFTLLKKTTEEMKVFLGLPLKKKLPSEFAEFPVDTFSITVRAPLLEHIGHRLSGSDTILLRLQLSNRGGGDARNIVASMEGEVIFMDSMFFIESIGPGERLPEDSIPAFKFLSPQIPLDSVVFVLTLTYNFAEIQEILLLREKEPPSNLKTTSLWDGVLIEWQPSADTLETGYRVYRASSPGEISQLLTEVPLKAFLYEDRTLAPGEKAYYWVSAVDTFFNESGLVGPIRGDVNPPQGEGSPIWVTELENSSPLIVDLVPEISGMEIVAATRDGKVFMFSSTGEVLPGWPFSIGNDNAFYGSPACGDLDKDGALEIVVAPRGPVNKVYALENDGSLVEGWPRSVSGGSGLGTAGVFASPVVADLDNDGTLEVIVKTIKGKIYIWHGDGTGYSDSTGLVFDAEEGSWAESQPAVGDIDLDDTLEIVFGTRQGKLYAISPRGEVKSGFPKEGLGQIMGSVVLGDIESDSLGLEIAFVGGSTLYLLDSNGDILPGWPKWGIGGEIPMHNHPSLADLDFNGTPEVLLNGENQIFAFDKFGDNVPSFPIDCFGGSGSSVIVGICDDTLRFFRGDKYGYTHGFSLGVPGEIPGFPIFLEEQQDITSTLIDLDGDSLLELIVGNMADRIWIFELGLLLGEMEWPMFRHDICRTGNYSFNSLSMGNFLSQKRIIFDFQGPFPNPLHLRGYVMLILPFKSKVEIFIYDIAGRRVNTLLDKEFPPGRHLIQFKAFDKNEHLLPSGVYFLRVKTKERNIVKKILHIR